MRFIQTKMKLRYPSTISAALVACAFFLIQLLRPDQARAAASKPNVVLILADDYGWKDLSCYGSEFYETPNIDRLASDGVKFTQAYAACTVCSPTRAALLTGKYPARLHVTDWIPGQMPDNPKLIVPDWTKYLPLEEMNLARALHSAGYTSASIGKWHLGSEPYYPDKQGFDKNIGGSFAAQPKSYFAPYKIATLPEGPDGEYLTDRLGDEAVHFIEANKDPAIFPLSTAFCCPLADARKRGTHCKIPCQKTCRPGANERSLCCNDRKFG